MDHRHIDQHSVAERYLEHTLTACERAQFETHLVDCPECTDRVLLAGMFQHRNGIAKPPQAKPEALRVRFIRQFTPWQLFFLLAGAAAVLVLLTAGLLLWASSFSLKP